MKTELISVNPRDLKLLELNARYMKHEEYNKLVENIKRDKALTSVPFCCLEDGKYKVLSGNHRVMASIDAGLEQIIIMKTDEPLTEDEQIAIQLSHNSIAGQDDPVILKQLYEKINEVDLKIYSGLDDETLDLLGKVESVSISESNLEFQNLSVVFLPDELEKATEIVEMALQLSKGNAIWVNRYEEYDKWLDSIEIVNGTFGIKNTATAIKMIFDIFLKHSDDFIEVYQDKEVKQKVQPLYPIIGTNNIDIETARLLNKCIEKMLSDGDIVKNERSKSLKILAENYLNNG